MLVTNLVLICLVEMYTTSEKRKNKDGFWELKTVLTSAYDNKPAHSNNLTIWCMALSPAPGHKVWNSSSEKITFFLGEFSAGGRLGLPHVLSVSAVSLVVGSSRKC
jgi:hypothetical protein